MKRMKSWLCLCCVLGLLAGFVGCSSSADKIEPQGRAFFTYFDTVSYVYSYAGDSEDTLNERSAAVSDILREYHQLFDIYHEYSGITNLCTINKSAGGEPLKVDKKLVDFLLYSKELYEVTDGEMNVMLGSVLRLWHDARTLASEDPANAYIPSEEALAEAKNHTDISLLEIDAENCTVRITDPEASIDVGALGKGYATEQAAQYLREIGAESYVLNIGGNISIIGHKVDGSAWNTGIRNPQDPSGEPLIYFGLADTACVTSGNYERYYIVEGEKYHHIIDKDTMMPAEYFDSITVITKDSALADTFSTALYCMSYEEGLELAESMEDVEVLWIFSDGTMKMTSGLEALVTE